MKQAFAWTIWLAAIAANGFIVFLWVVFGLAGGGNAAIPVVTWTVAVGAGLPLLVSMYLMTRQKYVAATLMPFAFVPSVISLLLLYGAVCGEAVMHTPSSSRCQGL